MDKLTGSFTSFVESRIFHPAGMNRTTYSYRDAEASGNLSQAFETLLGLEDWRIKGTRRIPPGFPLDSGGLMTASSGVISSAKDMVC